MKKEIDLLGDHLRSGVDQETGEEECNYPTTSWTNGFFKISWLYDQVVISDLKKEKHVILDGGDFESILQGLLAVKSIKTEDLY